MRRNRTTILTLCTLAWVGGVAVALGALTVYSQTPGHAGKPPADWPVASSIQLASNRPTLLVFLHPYCSCSQATLGELARLVRAARDRLAVHVLILRFSGDSRDSRSTALWRAAAQIPSVILSTDPDGREARRFAVQTSGAALLYDAAGTLCFHGGLTAARGHAGDNPGVDSVGALVRGEPGCFTTPVFGCPLFDSSCLQPAEPSDGETCCTSIRR